MARERLVTRTVLETTYNVMVVNMETLKVESVQVKVCNANTMTEKKLLEVIQKLAPDNMKYVTHEVGETKEVLYGMPENDFIRLAKVLPPR